MDVGVMAIGRSLDNDWVLHDPECLVSSRHCVIQYKDGRYYMTDNSAVGVELVNAGIRLRCGNSEPLDDGEVIRIGDYEIQARIDAAVALDDSGLSNDKLSHSFESLMQSGHRVGFTSAETLPAAHFQGGTEQEAFTELLDFLTPGSLSPPTRSDHVPAERHDFRPPTTEPTPCVIPEDWNAVAHATPPLVCAPVVEDVTPPVRELLPVNHDRDSDLLHTFLRGAGLDQLHIEPAQAEGQMEAIGRSYRLMVEGLIDLLSARCSLTGEPRKPQMLLPSIENNPLKFATNVDEALLLLLRHGDQAFMPPDRAIANSFDDLRGRQMAVMAGMDAAIKVLLKRFEPSELEARMGKQSAFANLFCTRQAPQWRHFSECYAQISREAQEDFQALFGREFSRAYDERRAR